MLTGLVACDSQALQQDRVIRDALERDRSKEICGDPRALCKRRVGCGVCADRTVAASTKAPWPDTNRSPRDLERAVLPGPCGVPVALSAQGVSSLHDRAKPLLCVARQRSMGADRERSGHGRP